VLLQGQPIPASAIRDTIARILQTREYREDVSATLLSRAWEWLTRHLGDLFREATQSRGAYIVSMLILTTLIVVAVARSIIVARARRAAASRRDIPITSAEQLAQARSLAAQGAWVEAAHLLYAAVVSALVEQRRVRRHPSKTVGDYGRDLRAAGDAQSGDYARFAQVYDIVAYGDGLCDAARFARLEAMAAPLLHTEASDAMTARAA
jgi:hypothetical protein